MAIQIFFAITVKMVAGLERPCNNNHLPCAFWTATYVKPFNQKVKVKNLTTSVKKPIIHV